MKKFLIIFFCCIFFKMPLFAEDNTFEYMNMNWWTKFNDEYLTDNFYKLYRNNFDLKNATLKIKANEEALKMQFAQELPYVTFSGEISRNLRAARQQFGDMQIPTYSQNNFYLPLTAGYEADIWGKNRFKTKSRKQQLEMAKQAERATYISLTSNFATDYFNLIKADKLIELQDELIQTQEQILSMTNNKHQIGLIPVTEVLYQEKILNDLRKEKNNYLQIKETLINNLRVYIADSDDEIKRNSFEDLTQLNNIAFEYDSKIVENRPDYLAEEANLKKIGFDVKAAKREFLPTFTIFGQIGLNAYTLSSLCNSPSQFFTAGVLPNIDLFSGGRKLSFLKIQKLKYEEALNTYQKTYLNGISEINSSLAEYKTHKRNSEESIKKLEAERKIYNLTQDKREIGSANNLEVLTEKEIYLTTEKENVSNKINTLIAIIGIYKATGGTDLQEANKSEEL